jgi:DNA-binding YbaB/EbfC family protein
MQEDLGNETVEASVGGGAVTVVMTGHQKIQSIKISPEAVDPEDVGTLEDLVVAAVNEASEKAKSLAEKRLGALTGGMKIPGMY